MDIKEEAPKELRDCLLGVEEIEDVFDPDDWAENIAKAQLEKCRGYMEAQVQAERERIMTKLTEHDINDMPYPEEYGNWILDMIYELKQEVSN